MPSKVNREKVLNLMGVLGQAVTAKEILEQSNCLVFRDGEAITFNDEVCVRMPQRNLFRVKGAVFMEPFRKVFERMPDEELEVEDGDEQVVVKGRNRRAGICKVSEVRLPVDVVPRPKKWMALPQKLAEALRYAITFCGYDETDYRTTHVHVTPQYVEGSDAYRFLRYRLKTGFKEEILIPAANLAGFCDRNLLKVSITMTEGFDSAGWIHFLLEDDVIISLRCTMAEYFSGIEEIVRMENPVKISLPSNLPDILRRSEIMAQSGWDARVCVALRQNLLRLRTEKELGWYEEEKRIRYDGEPLRFLAHPRMLADLVSQNRKVELEQGRLRVKTEDMVVLITLF